MTDHIAARLAQALRTLLTNEHHDIAHSNDELLDAADALGAYESDAAQADDAAKGEVTSMDHCGVGNTPEQLGIPVAQAVPMLDQEREHLGQFAVTPIPKGCEPDDSLTKTLPQLWQPMGSAPKDGTMVLLLIKDNGNDEVNPIEDELESRTIGSYGVHGGPDEDPTWTFVGWDWDNDVFEDGRGIPIAWAPLLPLPQPPTAAPEEQTFSNSGFAEHDGRRHLPCSHSLSPLHAGANAGTAWRKR